MNRPIKVYLSGGMVSGWQDKVKEAVLGLEYLDPRDHGFRDPVMYSTWDARAVDEADFVFAYLEATNPSGLGLAAEIGRACVQGKFIIFIDEWSDHRTALIREWSSVISDTLEGGIYNLRRFAAIYNCGLMGPKENDSD